MASLVAEISTLIISLAGTVFLGGLFLTALLNPTANAAFIFKAGMLVYLMEFLSIHSSAMATGFAPRGKDKERSKLKLAYSTLFFCGAPLQIFWQ